MTNPDIEFDHIGIAVGDLVQAFPFWKAMGWGTAERQEQGAVNGNADELHGEGNDDQGDVNQSKTLLEIPTEIVADQKVKVAMLPLKNSSQVELLEPTSKESPVQKFMDKRGPGIHHVCFRVKNIEVVLESLKGQGIRLINSTPVPGAHGCKVAFVHPSSTGGVLVELSEKGGHST